MSSSASAKLIAVVGPTASGKTALATALASKFNGEIIGVDASQIYQGFDIGTGKASAEELRGVKHHNIDIAKPDDDYNAARFVRETKSIVEDVLSRGKRPVFCGGTGLYFRALREGLCKAPKVPSEIRDAVLEEMSQHGVEALHEQLSQVDVSTARRIHHRDRQRIERSLSVYRFTGKPLSQWMSEGSFPGLSGEWCVLGLRWDAQLLRGRIERRVIQMVENGWLDEVKGIVEAGYGEQVRAFSALGYRFMLEVTEGQRSLQEGIEETVRQTRKYAKRQMTWFRKEQDIHWLNCPEEVSRASDLVSTFLEATK